MKALSALVVLSVLLSVVLVALVALHSAAVFDSQAAGVGRAEAPGLASAGVLSGPASSVVLLARAGSDTLSGEESGPPRGRTG